MLNHSEDTLQSRILWRSLQRACARARSLAVRQLRLSNPLFRAVYYVLRIFFIRHSGWARRRYVRKQFEKLRKRRQQHYITEGRSRVDLASTAAERTSFRTILVSNEPDWRYEWLELAIRSNGIRARIVYMPGGLFSGPFLLLLKDFLLQGTTQIDYRKVAQSRIRYERLRARLHKHLELLLKCIIDEFSPDVFVTASLGDAKWRDMIPVAHSLGIPWVVTEREGVIAPVVFRKNPALVRQSFETKIDLMCTSNNVHLEYWECIGIAGGEIDVVGELKTDLWSHPQFWPKRHEVHPSLSEYKVLITYFAFGPKNYIDERFFPEEIGDWTALQEDHYNVLKTVASEHRETLQFAIKGGRANDFTGYFSRDVKDASESNLIVFGSEIQALDLIVNSDLIIGFQTTAMIEAMFSEAPILYPAWGRPYCDVAHDLIPLQQSGAVHWIQSKKELELTIASWLEKPRPWRVDSDVMKNRKLFRELYFHCPDGNVGLRTYKKIDSFLTSLAARK